MYPSSCELEVALCEGRVHILHLWRPRPRVPQHDDPRPISFGDDAFEAAVLDGMIFDVHREPLGLRIERGPFGTAQDMQDAVVFETKVVVQVAGEVLLHAEEESRLRALRRVLRRR